MLSYQQHIFTIFFFFRKMLLLLWHKSLIQRRNYKPNWKIAPAHQEQTFSRRCVYMCLCTEDAVTHNKQSDQGFNVHAYSLWILTECWELRATRWEYLRMRSTRRLNKLPLPKGAGGRGQGYERNKKVEERDEEGGGAGGGGAEEKARNQSGISVVPLQHAGKQRGKGAFTKRLFQPRKKKIKGDLKINNSFFA